MASTSYSGGEVRGRSEGSVARGMEVWERQRAEDERRREEASRPPPPPPPPPPRYRLILENNEAEAEDWQALFKLMVQMDQIGYKLIKLERIVPEEAEATVLPVTAA